ncbi:MAG: M48 family peptidase [Alphaproteobacteria bacterium]|jgi:predicted Zn-dependent protease|nr:M48 family peptidase [Alphaproteobacteria bacterium]
MRKKRRLPPRALRAFAALMIGLFGAFATPSAASAQSLIRDAEIEDTLRVYSDPIFRAADLEPKDIKIYIVQDSSLNAFVSSGQNVFFHTGLIMTADNPEQLKGVIAHETGHIAGGHLTSNAKAAERAMVPAMVSIGLGVLAIAAGAGDAGAALIAGSQQFAMASFVRHTQVQESTADQMAVTFLEKTGQTPDGLIEFFDRQLRQYEFAQRRVPPYLMTHPLTSERVQALRARVDVSPFKDAKQSAEDLHRFAMMQAKLRGFLNEPGRTFRDYPAKDVSLPARYARAVAAYRVPDTGQAVKETQALITAEPNNPYFHELLGQILFESGKAKESVEPYRRSVALKPGSPMLEVGLARSLTAANGKAGADEAIALLQRSVTTEPDNAYAWREMANAYAAKGDETMAKLATAEEAFSVGNYPRARYFAEVAKKGLTEGTAAYRRASDIALVAENETRTAERGRGRS